MMGTFPSCQAPSKNVQVLDQPSPGANRLPPRCFFVWDQQLREMANRSGEHLAIAPSMAFRSASSQVLDEWIEKHAGRINGKDHDLLVLAARADPILHPACRIARYCFNGRKSVTTPGNGCGTYFRQARSFACQILAQTRGIPKQSRRILAQLGEHHSPPHRDAAAQNVHLLAKESHLAREVEADEISAVKYQPLAGVVAAAPNREELESWNSSSYRTTPAGRLLLPRSELLSHLICNQTRRQQ